MQVLKIAPGAIYAIIIILRFSILSSQEEVYAQIEADLIFAAENLPYVQTETGRATKGAAQALLGKVYLYQDNFSEAAEVLEDLIDNGPYGLVTDYTTLFENDNENNNVGERVQV